jgi:hypothetical protein
MFKKIIIITIAIFSLESVLSKDLVGRPRPESSEEWPQVILNLSEQGNLLEIFDSGLRPYRFPSLENGVLEAKHFWISVQIAGSEKLPKIPVDYATIKVYDTGDLGRLEFATPKLSEELARELYSPWLRYANRSHEELEFFLEEIKKEPQFWKTESEEELVQSGCPINWNATKNSSENYKLPAFVYFDSTMDIAKPLRIRLGFSWAGNHPLNGARNYRKPIPPPLGYEGVSMEAPKNYGPDSPTQDEVNESLERILIKRGIKKNVTEREREVPRKKSEQEGVKEKVVNKELEKVSFFSWPIIVAFVIFLAALGYWGLKKYFRQV